MPSGVTPYQNRGLWGYQLRDADGVIVPGLSRKAFAPSADAALADAENVVRVAMPSLGIVEGDPADPAPSKKAVATDRGAGVVRLSWQGIAPADITELGRVGPPVYGAGGWNTTLAGGAAVLAKAKTDGHLDMSEARPGVEWEVYVVAAGQRYTVKLTPAAPVPPPPRPPVPATGEMHVDAGSNTGSDL